MVKPIPNRGLGAIPRPSLPLGSLLRALPSPTQPTPLFPLFHGFASKAGIPQDLGLLRARSSKGPGHSLGFHTIQFSTKNLGVWPPLMSPDRGPPCKYPLSWRLLVLVP